MLATCPRELDEGRLPENGPGLTAMPSCLLGGVCVCGGVC